MTPDLTSAGFYLFPEQENEQKEYDYIFIHIPRTGGRTIHYRLGRNFNGQHTTIKEYIDKLTEPVVRSKFKFTTVRNPWDRALALWNLYIFGGMWVPSINDPVPSLDDWILQLEKARQMVPSNPPFDLESLSCCKNYQGEILIDEFVRFENLEEDFNKKIAPKLNLPSSSLETFGMGGRPINDADARKKIEKILDNQISHGVLTIDQKNKIMDAMPYVSSNYREMFKTQEAKEIVGRYNQELIRDFGYRF